MSRQTSLTNFFGSVQRTSDPFVSMRQTMQLDVLAEKYPDIPRMREYLDITCPRCKREFERLILNQPMTLHHYLVYITEHIQKCAKREDITLTKKDYWMEAFSIFFGNINNLREEKKSIRGMVCIPTCDICHEDCKNTFTLSGNLYTYLIHLEEHKKEELSKSITEYMEMKYPAIIRHIES